MNEGFTPVTPVKFWVQKVLPLVYDGSLSYIEVLSKFGDKLNEVINIVNYQGEGIYGYIKEQLEAYKDEWQKELAAAMAEMTAQISQNNTIINGRIDDLTSSVEAWEKAFKQEVDNELSTQNAAIAELEASVTGKIANLTALIVSTDKTNRAWTLQQIDLAISKLPDDFPPVVDPTDGQTESIQTVVNHLWDAMRENALTAQEYDDLELTAQAYDDYGLTAVAYDRAGKLLLAPNGEVVNEVPLNSQVTADTVRALAVQVQSLTEQQAHTTSVLRNANTLKEVRQNA